VKRGTPEIDRRENGGYAQLTGRSPENLAIGQAIELFSLVMPFEDFRSSRWVTGQHAGGEIEPDARPQADEADGATGRQPLAYQRAIVL
jgi:hypothetical protein